MESSSSKLQRIDDVVLVHQSLSEHYLCPLCTRLLCKPLQASCGHRFCSGCVAEEIKKPNPVCPEDGIPLEKEEVFRDIGAEREICSLEVYCPSVRHAQLCQWRGKMRDLEAHVAQCSFVRIRCPNDKCHKLIQRGSIARHAEISCEHRPATCQFCGISMNLSDLDHHQKFVCALAEDVCPNGCGETIQRCMLPQHKDVCPLQTVVCEFCDAGCRFQSTRIAMADHVANSPSDHLLLMRRQQTRDREIMSEQSRAISSLMGAVESLKERVETLEGRKALSSSSTAGNSTLGPSHHTPRSGHFETANLGEQMSQLRLDMNSEQRQRHSLERTVALHDLQLSELNLRQDLEQIKTTTGVMVWKISEFTRRCQEAISEKTPSLYSPPFYTSACGYKLCARLYPNGDGIGKGSHLSLFFVVMRGEFDALLPWPFSQKVSLMLLDQRRVNPRHCIETFRPDVSSSSFQRPDSELNVATGCPLFISLAALQGSSSYVVDETIFIKIIVHQQGLISPDSAV